MAKISISFLWKLSERFGVGIVQFVLQIVLARLLTPKDYGALSIMIIFTTIANIFIQNGFNTALIQNKDTSEEDYSSVMWVSLFIAAMLYGVIFVCAPYIGNFYDVSEIVWPLRVLSLMLFPGVLNSVQLAKVSRDLDFKKVFYSNLSGIIVSGGVGITVAYFGGGLWALVLQALTNVSVVCLVMLATVKLKFYFVCSFERIKVLFSFGWKLLVSSLIDTIYADLRSLVIGKKYCSSVLGYYDRGKQFPQFVISAINGAVQSVMLPAMSAVQDDRVRVKAIMRNSIMLSAYIVFPMMAGLAAIAEPLIRLLLTDKWLPCVPFMQIYCFTFAFWPVHTSNLQAINALGRSDIFLKLEIIKKAYGLIALVIAVYFFDSPIAIASTGLITAWIGWFVNAYPNKKLIGYAYKEQIIDVLPSFVLAILMGGVVWVVGSIEMSLLVMVLVQILIGILVYLFLSIIFKPTPYKLAVAYLKNRFV